METVGQLDQNDPRIPCHRQEELAVVLDLLFRIRGELHTPDLGDSVDNGRDVLAKALFDVHHRDACVLYDVVDEARNQGLSVETERRENGRHFHRVTDEFVARRPPLTRVGLPRQVIRVPHRVHIEAVGVRLHRPGQGPRKPTDGLGSRSSSHSSTTRSLPLCFEFLGRRVLAAAQNYTEVGVNPRGWTVGVGWIDRLRVSGCIHTLEFLRRPVAEGGVQASSIVYLLKEVGESVG